jgi:hypothetical protein
LIERLYIYVEHDRKANIDVLEANKTANKEDIKKLRDDNKEFRQKLAILQRVLTSYLTVILCNIYFICFLFNT